MIRRYPLVFFLAQIVLFAAASPAQAQSAFCNTSQTMAAKCFAQSAITSDIAAMPAGMTMAEYQSYGVAVLRILQSTDTAVILLGTTSAISDAMPATNANGTANTAAQTTAINAIISAGLSTTIITLPTQTTQAQLELFAQQAVTNMGGFNGVSLSPGSILRLIDSYIVTATSSNGTINWTTVNSSLTTAVNNLISSGMVKLPSSVTTTQFTTFVEDVAQAIAAYKSATDKKSL